MKKCDFCEWGDEKGKCYWTMQTCRTPFCEKALKLMCKALKEDNNDL